jgi:hypothetical protein
MLVVESLRRDLLAAHNDLVGYQTTLRADGYDLSTLRVLDILVWTQLEPNGFYRG